MDDIIEAEISILNIRKEKDEEGFRSFALFLTNLPKIRPHLVEKVVDYCKEFFPNSLDFKETVIVNGLNKCPIVIRRLFFDGKVSIDEILPSIEKNLSFFQSLYFMEFIPNFSGFTIGFPINSKLVKAMHDENLTQLIDKGFLPNTVEFCLKYDLQSDFQLFFQNPEFSPRQKMRWSIFEWSKKPPSLNMLAFAGFFCALNCFKYLIMNGFVIDDEVIESIYCGGELDLVHMCQRYIKNQLVLLPIAVKHMHLSLVAFLFDNGVDFQKIDYKISFPFFQHHCCIWPFRMNHSTNWKC